MAKVIKNRPSFDVDDEDEDLKFDSSSDFVNPLSEAVSRDTKIPDKLKEMISGFTNQLGDDFDEDKLPELIDKYLNSDNSPLNNMNMGEIMDMLRDSVSYIGNLEEFGISQDDLEKSLLFSRDNYTFDDENLKDIKLGQREKAMIKMITDPNMFNLQDDKSLEEYPFNEAMNLDPVVKEIVKANDIHIYGDINNDFKNVLGTKCKGYASEDEIPANTIVYVSICDIYTTDSEDNSTDKGDVFVQLRTDTDKLLTISTISDYIENAGEWLNKWGIVWYDNGFLLRKAKESLIKENKSDPISDLTDYGMNPIYDSLNESLYSVVKEKNDEYNELTSSPDGLELMSIINKFDNGGFDSVEEFNSAVDALDLDDDLKAKYKKPIDKSKDIINIMYAGAPDKDENISVKGAIVSEFDSYDYPSLDIKYINNKNLYSSIVYKPCKNLMDEFKSTFMTDGKTLDFKKFKEITVYTEKYNTDFNFNIDDYNDFAVFQQYKDKFLVVYFAPKDDTKSGVYLGVFKTSYDTWGAFIPTYSNGFNPETGELYDYKENPEYFYDDEDEGTYLLKGAEPAYILAVIDLALFKLNDDVSPNKLRNLGRIKLSLFNQYHNGMNRIGNIYFNDSEIAYNFKLDNGIDRKETSYPLYLKVVSPYKINDYYMAVVGFLLNCANDINDKQIIRNSVVKFDKYPYIELDFDAFIRYISGNER